MSVFDRLPKRRDGTEITPWDKDWDNDVRRGIFEPRWNRVRETKKIEIAVPEPVKTGEKVPSGLMLMFVKGGYKKLFERLYGERK